MKVVKKKMAELKHPEKNVRMHSDKQLVEFKRSIEMFGQIRPIVIDENNVMLAGNGLYEAMSELGFKEADCIIVDGLSENEKKKLMLADNKVFELGVNDIDAFDEILKELSDDLDIPGYDSELLEAILSEPEDVDDIISSYGVVPEDKKTVMVDNANLYNERLQESTEPANYEPTEAPNVVDTTEEEPEEVHKYVVCPKCGEKIWL